MSTPTDRIVVVGAGCSTLISELVEDGYSSITAVDISRAALEQLRTALGARAGLVTMVVSDVCDFEPDEQCAVWHDRATFHFLTGADTQHSYVERASAALRSGGHLVLSGFAPGGPLQCSGLDVARHSLEDLEGLFGNNFDVIEQISVDHVTPWGSTQQFLHTLFRRH